MARDDWFSLANLKRAWGWVQSNPRPVYKNYFRSSLSRYKIAEDQLLKDLSDRLKRRVYEPAHGCKVSLPKASGGLRLYTLLTVEDQIVYQAAVNVIAERFHPVISPYYYWNVFSHIYAGKESTFFYKEWEKGYQAFNRAARRSFRHGLNFAATFDFTACFDSIDHSVLEHLMVQIGCDRNLCADLRRLLAHWTATAASRRVYQGHRIPQGPLSSGLLAELVLHYVDKGQTNKQVRYIRYVDDIRLFAASEKDVRRAVYNLELLSKDIGLFPQSSKIHIHKIVDIESELKGISRPDDEESWANIADDQDEVHRLLLELTIGARVSDETGAITPHRRFSGKREPQQADLVD